MIVDQTGATPQGRAGRYRAYSARELVTLAVHRLGLSDAQRTELDAVTAVLPFRANTYVVDELIDWSAGSADPIYRLTFPQPGLLAPRDLAELTGLMRAGAPPAALRDAVSAIRRRLNPHPSGQRDLNQPVHRGRPLPGLQHKYQETLLVFPQPGQTCHAYCTYCFRWPQFVHDAEMRIATSDVASVVEYLADHPAVSDVLITGGDPMVMSAAVLARYVEPLLAVPTVRTIRVGTKALSLWPYRFVSDADADDLLRLCDRVVASGRHFAVMAHLTHPRELAPPVVAAAVRRLRDTGAVVRGQGPLVRGINDDAATWADLWRAQVGLGAVPYYMFVERDTGPQDYFAVPLERAHAIYRDALAAVSGLARTARGPVMSASAGKVCVDGVTEVAGERVFVLRLLQARDPALVGRPFFAAHDPDAIWFTDLRPAFGAAEFLPGWTGRSDGLR